MEGHNSEETNQVGSTIEEDAGTSSMAPTVEIRIKTLDSQVYTCRVEQNISVPALKEQVAVLTGVPPERQRLICKGKVLKDDHNLSAYNVEDGHTLHLVTRQVPPPAVPSSSGGGSRRVEEQGPTTDPSPAAGRNRPGQVAHSVLLGTFSIPDHGDGGVPDVGRIISSVLSSLGVPNFGQANLNGGTIGGMVMPAGQSQPILSGMQESQAVGGQVPAGTDGHQAPSGDVGGGPAVDSHDAGNGLRMPVGLVGSLTSVGQQARLLQQVIPDALTTMSQYLNRLDQVFANGQQTQSPPFQTTVAPTPSPAVGTSAGSRAYPVPANLGAIIRRTMALFNGQAGAELARLASQLENEPTFVDAASRAEVQSLALRNGVLLQHLGALLLELGRATSTLRMGASSLESAVNSGPAVFISQAGPNPMMVQPLPFQPVSGIGNLTGAAPQGVGASSPGVHDMPRNINIHIHTSDTGSGLPPQVMVPVQGGLVSHNTPPVVSGDDRSVAPSQQSTVSTDRPATHVVSVPVQGNNSSSSEQTGVRIMPMRTVVAAIPAGLHNRPPVENAGTSLGVFYPLLARFQQLNSQQVNGIPAAASLHGAQAGSPALQAGATAVEQPTNAVAPTIRAQVQVQAWVPSPGHASDEQGVMRSSNTEETLNAPLPSTSAGSPSQQQNMRNSRADPGSQQNSALQSDHMPGSVSPLVDQQAVVPHDTLTAKSHPVDEDKHESAPDASKTSAVNDQTNVGTSSGSLGGNKSKAKDHDMPDAPVGLGLRGLQPLPARTLRRATRQHQNQQNAVIPSSQSAHDQHAEPMLQENDPAPFSNGRSGPSVSRQDGPVSTGAGSGHQFPSGISQILNAVVNQNQLSRSDGTNMDIGSLISQVMAHTGNSSTYAMPTTENSNQSSGLPAAALSSLMGQVMQSPFMRNVVQQVVEQVDVDEPHGTQEAFSSMGFQGGLNFSSMVQQMMPIVSQALSRVSGTNSDQIANSNAIGNRQRDNGVERSRVSADASDQAHGLREIELDGLNGSNLSAMLQQMMPAVAQAFGRALGDVPQQASGGVLEQLLIPREGQEHTTAQAELPQVDEVTAANGEQEEPTPHESEVNPGSAPIAKRQKIELEKAIEKIEQGNLPSDIMKVIAETAAASMAINNSQGENATELAEHLAQDDSLVHEYVALLQRDLGVHFPWRP